MTPNEEGTITSEFIPTPIDLPDVERPSELDACTAWENILRGTWAPKDIAIVAAFESPRLRDAVIDELGNGFIGEAAYVTGFTEVVRDIVADIDAVTVNLANAARCGNVAILWTALAQIYVFRTGDRARANMALEAALAVDPRYRAARLTQQALSLGLLGPTGVR